MGRKSDSDLFLEQILATLKAVGFQVIDYKEYKESRKRSPDRVVCTNYCYEESLYGGTGRSKTLLLLLSDQPEFRILIKCIWQHKPGTADKKLPYFYLNFLEAVPEEDVIILVGGKGASEGSIRWLKEVTEEKRYATERSMSKGIRFMNQPDFTSWVGDKFGSGD